MKRKAEKSPQCEEVRRVLNKYSGGLPEDPDSAQAAYRELSKALSAADPATPAEKRIALLYLLSEYCLDHRGVDEAVEYMDLMLTLLDQAGDYPQTYMIHMLQGRVLHQEKQWDAALEAFGKAFAAATGKAGPLTFAEIHHQMGKVYFEQDKHKSALEHFHKQIDLVQSTGNPEEKAKAYECAGLTYLKDKQLDLALDCLNQARELYVEENLLPKINNIDNYIGMAYFWKGDYAQALKIYNSTLSKLEKTDLTYVNILVQIGTMCQYLGDYAKSLQYLLESAELREEVHQGFGLASNYLCLGLSYFTIADCEQAEKYYRLALELYREQKQMDGVLKAQVNLGILAKQKMELQKALDYFLPALKAAREIDDQYLYSNIITNMSDIYFQQQEYDKALELNREALAIKQRMGHKGDIVKLYIAMAEQYLGLQDLAAAKDYAQKCLDLAKELDMKGAVTHGYLLLSNISEKRRNFKQALSDYKLYVELHETLINETTNKNISELKIKYDTQAREREAELLRQKTKELEDKNSQIELQKANLQETLDKLYQSEIRYDFVSSELTRNIGTTLIGGSQTIRSITKMIALVAKSDRTNVLITGETGTGKEIVARNIHRCSKRGKLHFYAVNCSAVPENLFESQFFGHEKDAFTGANAARIGWFEIANHSTLFLDEIGSLSFDQQAKFLRALEERCVVRVGSHREIPIDLRIVSATNVNLAQKVEDEEFRRDLYHRLAIFVINIPPLREHKEDIPLLLKHFVGLAAQAINKRITRVEKDVIGLLSDYHFPGNVRELRNMVERAVLVADSSTLRREHFLIQHTDQDIPLPKGIVPLDDLEREMILKALQATGYNRVQAAKLLGVDRKVVERKILKHNIGIPSR